MTRTPLAKEVRFTVPLTPPSVNAYVRHSRGRHYKSAEARSFQDAVAICARGASIREKEYAVAIGIFLAAGQKGDLDNFAKCALDALVSAGVIHSDAAITTLMMSKERDAKNPRTEFAIYPGQAVAAPKQVSLISE